MTAKTREIILKADSLTAAQSTSTFPPRCKREKLFSSLSSPCINRIPTTVLVIPVRFFQLNGSFNNTVAKSAVKAGVAPVRIPASMELVKSIPYSKNMRNKEIPNIACSTRKSKSFADIVRKLSISFFRQAGNKKRRAKKRLAEAMVNVPSFPETRRAEMTLVPARENAKNK